MAFLTPALLAGVLLIAAPILLHLATRRQPRREVFPALRLLRKEMRRTETRLQLRRWLLLALRCAAIALLALALARPVMRPQPVGGEAGLGAATGPAGEGLALGVVIDNAQGAAYRSDNRTRLDAARENAGWLLEQAPSDARVTLADRSRGGRAIDGDRDAALVRLGRMTIDPASRSLGAAVRDALERLAEAPAARREAYVFTDFSAGAWDDAAEKDVRDALDERPGVAVRLVDVGVPEPRNVGVVAATPASESLVVGEPLGVRVTLAAAGAWPEGIVAQLLLDTGDGPVKRDERKVDLEAPTGDGVQRETSIEFLVTGLERGFHSGEVRVLAADALAEDDQRPFCVEVTEPRAVWCVGASEDDAVFVRQALAPAGVAARFRVVATSLAEFESPARARELASSSPPACVWLLDPPPFDDPAAWRRLADYTGAGGSVAIALGRSASTEGMGSTEGLGSTKGVGSTDAQALVPARLRWRSREETYLRPTTYAHPAIAALSDYAEAIPWSAFPVFQRWELESVDPAAAIVATYADGSPAIVERRSGAGRVLLVTTSFSDGLNEPDPWNLLPTGEDPWPFVLLVNSLTDYLSGAGSARLNYTAGESVTVPLPPAFDGPGFILRTPRGEALRQAIPPGRRDVVLGVAQEPGAYRAEAGGASATLDRRFAVALDPATSRVERIDAAALVERLGPDRVRLVDDRAELAASITVGQVGHELYGWALGLVALVFAAEHLVSNRFYRDVKEGR
ncbi:MAG: BatA domain-containing protein [Lacipirellulaceae bacterium]